VPLIQKYWKQLITKIIAFVSNKLDPNLKTYLHNFRHKVQKFSDQMKQFDQNACASVKVFEKFLLGFCSINKSMAPIKLLDMTFEKCLEKGKSMIIVSKRSVLRFYLHCFVLFFLDVAPEIFNENSCSILKSISMR